MSTRGARRMRRRATEILMYRAWAESPATGLVPSISVLSDPSIHRHERNRELRLAQNGRFTTPAAVGIAASSAA